MEKKAKEFVGSHDDFIREKFKERLLMSFEKELFILEDKEGNATRQDYNSDYWKGQRVAIKQAILTIKEQT